MLTPYYLRTHRNLTNALRPEPRISQRKKRRLNLFIMIIISYMTWAQYENSHFSEWTILIPRSWRKNLPETIDRAFSPCGGVLTGRAGGTFQMYCGIGRLSWRTSGMYCCGIKAWIGTVLLHSNKENWNRPRNIPLKKWNLCTDSAKSPCLALAWERYIFVLPRISSENYQRNPEKF